MLNFEFSSVYARSESDIFDAVVKDVEEKLKYIRSNGFIKDLLKSLKEELRLANRVLAS